MKNKPNFNSSKRFSAMIILLVVSLFMVSFASALEFDNFGVYNDEIKEVVIYNCNIWFIGCWSAGEEIGRAKLITPVEDYIILPGYTQFAEFNLSVNQDYNDIIKSIDFYDKKYKDWDKYKYTRSYDIKYKTYQDISQDIYKNVLIGYTVNGTALYKPQKVGEEIIQEVIWENLNSVILEKNEEVVIGLFTEVKEGEYTEWIPEIYGVKISEWAEFTGAILYENHNGSGNFFVTKGKAIAQSFTIGTTGANVEISVNGISVELKRVGTVGTYQVEIRGVLSAEEPNSTVYYYGTIEGSSIGTVGKEWYNISMSNTTIYKLQPSTQYFLTIYVPSNDDVDDYLEWETNMSGYAGGKSVQGNGNGTGLWTQLSTGNFDTSFQIWGNARVGITLNSPVNDLITNNQTVIFNATVNIIEVEVINVSLLIDGIINETNTSTVIGEYIFQKDLLTGQHNWSIQVVDNESIITSSETRNLTIEIIPPQILIESPVGTLDYNFIGGNETLNVTFTDTSLDSCWYNYNGTNITIEGCLTGVKNSNEFILESNNFNITLYANDTVGNLNSTFINWSYNLLANSIVFSEQARSGSLENFTINVTIAEKFTGVSMLLNYDGVNHSMTSTSSNHIREYTTQLTVPLVSVEENITLFFIATLFEGDVITIINTDEENQTVSPFLIDDCSAFTKTLLSFEMVDEDSLNEIDGTIEITLKVFSIGTTDLVNSFNKSFDYLIGQDSKICLENITEDYSMSYQIRHFGDETQYFKKYRNIQLLTINNDTISQNITLYNLNLTRGNSFNVIVVGNLLSSQGNAGLLVDTQRQYLATNEFLSVESPITDSSGVAISNLVQTEEIYNFLISFNGELLGTFNNYQVKCANAALGQCSITLNLATATGQPADFETFGNITQVFLLNTNTNVLHHTFSSTDGASKTVRSLVIKNDGYANETICDSTTTGTSGTILCPIGITYRNVSIMIQTFVGGEMIGTKQITQGPDIDWQGADILIMLLMFSSLTLLFLAHPITIVLGSILGLAIPVIFITSAEASLGVLFGAVLFYIAAGIVAIVVIAKKKN